MSPPLDAGRTPTVFSAAVATILSLREENARLREENKRLRTAVVAAYSSARDLRAEMLEALDV